MLTPEEVWRRYDAIESRLTATVSERMLDLAGLRPGLRVLDLATGRGEPALGAARRVGPAGQVVGVEISDAMLRMAQEKADREGLANLTLRVGNAEVLDELASGDFHAVTIRWGLMYMAAPVAALEQARRVLRSDGVLVAALWAEPERVPYFTLPRRLLERYRRLPVADPEAPGVFRFANPARIDRDFTGAGFTLEHVEELEVPVFEAATAAEIVAWVRAFGLEALLADVAADDQRAWENDLVVEMERGRTDGVMRLGGVTRLVRARPA